MAALQWMRLYKSVDGLTGCRSSTPRYSPAQHTGEETMNDEIYAEIAKSLEAGEPLVLATVASARGSTPRKPGAKMVVRTDGTFFGTIGGGCGEAEVWQKAMEVIESGRPEIVHVDLTTPVDGDDKICGGVMDVFVERISNG